MPVLYRARTVSKGYTYGTDTTTLCHRVNSVSPASKQTKLHIYNNISERLLSRIVQHNTAYCEVTQTCPPFFLSRIAAFNNRINKTNPADILQQQ